MGEIPDLVMAPELAGEQCCDKSKEFAGTHSPGAGADFIPVKI
jgi:hypothetical protein